MTDRVAIVTGAGQGIGRAIALRLAHDGMQVVVADVRGELAASVAEEVRFIGRKALSLQTDVTSADDRQHLFEHTLLEFGHLDVLVNNAAVQRIALPLDVDEAHWDAVMSVNAKAVYFCCQHALRLMLPQRRGCIVNIASMAGKIASTLHHPVYNVSKAAVIAMTKTFAQFTAAEGIRVNCVCPGIIETPMQDLVDREIAQLTGQTPVEVREGRAGRIPMKRVGKGDDVAAVVSFLAGPDSSYMTGQAINVTGGMITY